MSFEQQLTLSVVDKFAVAAFIVLIGMYANRALEAYKARATFIAGYTNQHIAAISDAWGLMFSWEHYIRRMLPYEATLTDEQRLALLDDLSGAIAESRRRQLEIRDFVEAHRFWLGTDLYYLLVTYQRILDRYVTAVLQGDFNRVRMLRGSLMKNKQDIMSLLQLNRRAMY